MSLDTYLPYKGLGHRMETRSRPIFNDDCMQILQILRNSRLVDSFNDNLEPLAIKLNCIKLQFIIWLRSTHSVKLENEKAVHELLQRLSLFLVHSSGNIRDFGDHGMIDDTELKPEDSFDQDRLTCSKLEDCFGYHILKFLERKNVDYRASVPYNAWIVTEPVQCLNFLSDLNAMIEDLFSCTEDSLSIALATGYASSVMKGMTESELLAIAKSVSSSCNVLRRAAKAQIQKLQTPKTDTGQGSIGDIGRHPIQGKVCEQSKTKPVRPDLHKQNQTVKGPEQCQDVTGKFSKIVEQSIRSQELALKENRPSDHLARSRIMAELRNVDRSSPFVSIYCINGSIMDLLGIVKGPPETPFENGIFFLKLDIPEDYPLKPANYRFLTKVYHPNVDPSGQLVVNIPEAFWSINCSLWGLLASIYGLIACPQTTAATASWCNYESDRRLFDLTAREWTKEYATGDWPLDINLPTTVIDQPVEDDEDDDDDDEDEDWVIVD